MAAGERIERSLRVSKTRVLPLNDPAITGVICVATVNLASISPQKVKAPDFVSGALKNSRCWIAPVTLRHLDPHFATPAWLVSGSYRYGVLVSLLNLNYHCATVFEI